jgi:hypothetical protein
MRIVADVRVQDMNKTPLQNHTAYCNVDECITVHKITSWIVHHAPWGKGGKGQWVPGFFTLIFRVKFKVPTLYVPTSQNPLAQSSYAQSSHDSKFQLFNVPMLKVPMILSSTVQSSYSSKFLQLKVPTLQVLMGSNFLLLQSSY